MDPIIDKNPHRYPYLTNRYPLECFKRIYTELLSSEQVLNGTSGYFYAHIYLLSDPVGCNRGLGEAKRRMYIALGGCRRG